MKDPRPLLPHGPAMHYVHEIVEATETSCRCLARFGADNPFARSGAVPAFVAIEAIAQASAAHELQKSGPDEPPRIGFLVTATDLVFAAEPIPVETEFEVRVTLTRSVGPLAEYDIEARGENVVWVTGSMKAFVTAE